MRPQVFVFLCIGAFGIVEWWIREKGFDINVKNISQACIRYGIYIALILTIGLFGAFNASEFIYFQF